jgi:CheY-like chemotaxis protein
MPATMNGRVGLDRLAALLPAGAAASRTLPDLILLDYMAPELNSAGFLRAMRARDEYRHIPVLMMSSVDEATLREQCSRLRRLPVQAVRTGRAHGGGDGIGGGCRLSCCASPRQEG